MDKVWTGVDKRVDKRMDKGKGVFNSPDLRVPVFPLSPVSPRVSVAEIPGIRSPSYGLMANEGGNGGL